MLDTPAPRRIGRYEIVGRLATGGMAEVLLGRLHGPHGFERPVVIKRILPHLALDRGIVDMFLDEARIIANLRHPNLIHVDELGTADGELFIAMEFLEGESVSGLCRRLATHGELLDFDLAAYIVAEACAGLHAAHEATSTNGRPLSIVHRDVSPQNIFVSYSGAIHVIDFGIATTADRISRTATGTVRGKFEYLSPEQLHALPLDRRADVFALGVVLFELASGRRAYKRPSPAETMMAILKEPPPELSAFRLGAPSVLEAICRRALCKDRSERYQTAGELRRELLTFVRGRTDDDPGDRLGKVMRDLFSDRVTEKTQMLGRVRQGSEVATLPAAEVDIDVELPTAAPEQLTSTASSQALPLRNDERRRRRFSVPVWGLVAALALSTITMGWRLRQTPAQPQTLESQGGSPPIAGSITVPTTAPVPSSASPNVDPPVVAESAQTDPSAVPRRGPGTPRPSGKGRGAPSPPRSSPRSAPTLW